MALKDYRELIAWQRAVDLVEMIYRMTADFPKTEVYALTSQIRRAAVSIPSNVAEGQGRRTTRDFLYFLSVANGSLKEVETQIIVSQRLGFLDEHKKSKLIDLTTEVGRLISGLRKSLEQKHDPR